MKFRINVTNNKLFCGNEGDLSGSKSRSKFQRFKCFISCCQRQSIKEDDTEMAEQRRFVYPSQTSTEKFPNYSSDRLFDRSAMASRPSRSQQFEKVQSRVSLHSYLHRHPV